MSLFESASLVVTPNGTKASKLYAIKPTDGSGDLTVTRATTARRVNSAGLISSVANNVPRLDYTNGTCPSILVEPQRTNLILRSQEIDNASWNKDNSGTGILPVVTANYTTAPDGTNTADRVQFSNIGKTLTTDYSLIGQYPITLGGTGTFTIYLKSNTSSNQNVLCYWGAGEGNVFSVTPQWQRFTLPNLSIGLAGIALGSRGGFGFTAGGDQTLDISIWGAQLEAGSYPTSYIPTTSASVTRNADVISKTGISSLIGQTEGTLFLDTIINNLSTPTNFSVLCYLKGSSELYIEISTSGVITAIFYDGSSTTGSITGSLGFTSGRHKFAFAYKSNDFILYVDGAQFGVDTSGLVSGTLTELGLQYYSNNYLGSQKVNTATLFKTRLTNAELAILTTI